jgi:hypothetical protein
MNTTLISHEGGGGRDQLHILSIGTHLRWMIVTPTLLLLHCASSVNDPLFLTYKFPE